jgi:hypothetical protein
MSNKAGPAGPRDARIIIDEVPVTHRFDITLLLTLLLCASSAGVGCNSSVADGAPVYLGQDTFYSVWEITPMSPSIDTVDTPAAQLQDDDDEVLYALPFAFDFYGAPVTSVYLTTNAQVMMGAYFGDYETALLNYTGPTATPWNSDLDSTTYGAGAQVQAFSFPSRLVFDWDSASHADAMSDIRGHVQMVFYPSGSIFVHFISFDPGLACNDAGSGITLGDGIEALDLSAILNVEVCTLAGRSFEFRPI